MAPDTSSTNKPTDAAASCKMPVACSHCGLPVPAGLIEEGSQHQFCCNGCKTVWEVIHGTGLEQFYRMKAETGEPGRKAGTTGRGYEDFDDPAYNEAHVVAIDEHLNSTEFYLEGVHCAACVWLVEKLPNILDGVLEARLDMRKSLVRVTWEPQQVRLSRIARTLDSLGYAPHPARDAHTRQTRTHEDRRFIIRLAVAGAAAGNVMLLAFALYGGMLSGIEREYNTLFRWFSMVIGLVALFWPGWLFFRGAIAAIRTRTAHLDLPIALGLVAGASAGVVNTILGRGEIYFDSLTVLIFLLLVGRWIQHRQQRWASDSLELLFSLAPDRVRLVDGDTTRDAPIEAVKVGDTAEVIAGESIPVDGVVVEGESTIDQSLLTGESRPIAVREGDGVCAGAVNLSSQIRVRVQSTGENTRVGKLMRLVEEFTRRKAPIVQLADRVAGWFVAAVITLAVVTFVVWLRLDPVHAVDHATALLIVTCPCALGLATPMAVAVAIGRAAKRGILIKGGDALETLAGKGRIMLDKTGTITTGSMAVVQWHGDTSIRDAVAALEARSSHPIARAFTAEIGNMAFAPTPETFSQTSGAGVEGIVDGRRFVIGSPQWVRGKAESHDARIEAAEAKIIAAALTPILIAVDEHICAAVGVGDPIRDDSHAAVDRLKSLDWRVGILSGDHAEVVAAVARQLGITEKEALGGVTPEGKLKYINTHHTADSIVMVGDGVNDSAAMSAAHVGIAVHGGAEASLAASDIYLNSPGLAPIVDLVFGARRTMRVIRRCLIISLLYNGIAAALAMTGIINPLIAAILMPISSFTVLTIALTSNTFGDETCQ